MSGQSLRLIEAEVFSKKRAKNNSRVMASLPTRSRRKPTRWQASLRQS
ncbi:hypothetical protein SH528x_005531 [Novipirellula sp. SH528]